jgi:hypothetical protein
MDHRVKPGGDDQRTGLIDVNVAPYALAPITCMSGDDLSWEETVSIPETVQQHSNEIIVAAIGLIGVVTTALLSNWDKLFRKVVQAPYSGYIPTKNFETELRVFFEISGTRKLLEAQQEQLLQNIRASLLIEQPGEAENINKHVDAVRDEAIKYEEVVKAILPVYQKYYNIGDIQELNKFYSTDIMQNMAAKGPLIAQDLAPIQNKMFGDYLKRLNKRLSADSDESN